MPYLTTLRRLALVVVVLAGLLAPGQAQAFRNGQAPRAALARIYHPTPGTQVLLERRAAAAWNTMSVCAYAQGVRLYAGGPQSAYRTLAGQVVLRAYWTNLGHPANAAVPGTSNHGLGLAIDLGNPPVMRRWIDAHGRPFGWAKAWSDASWEPWHLKYRAGVWTARPNPGPYPDSPRLSVGSRGACTGPAVRRVQGALGVSPTANYGQTTAAAVRRFQARQRIPVNGVMTAGTWRRLRAQLRDRHQHARAPVAPKPPKKLTTAKPRPAAALGVDVSVYQGDVDWPRVRRAGYTFAVVKASEGLTYRDPLFTAARVRAVRGGGMALGVYHFMRPRPGRSAVAEARYAVATARTAGALGAHDLPLILDLETTAIGRCETMSYARRAAAEVRRLVGRWPILYSYPGFLNSASSSCRKQLAGLRLWVAHYRVTRPLVPSPWSAYTLWQHNDSGTVPGIRGHVDLNLIAGGATTLNRLTRR